MLPGERITLIKKIASRLSRDSLEEIRLILNQFGRPITSWVQEHGYEPDAFATVIRTIENAPDQVLVGLDHHLFGGASPDRRGATAASIWPEQTFRLFISHSSVHKDRVGFLAMMLESRGIHGFVAHTDIEPTHEWQDEIESALDTCDALAAYLTPDFVTSRWCDQEVGFCVGRAIPILPIRMGADPHGFVGKYQALQGFGKTPLALADEIADIVVAHPQSALKMAAPAVHAFARANSFDEARAHWERIKVIPIGAWTTEMALEATNAARTNNQLSLCVTSDGPLPDVLASFLSEIFPGRAHAQ